jgi:putative FmdB family regulatory protein
LAVRDGRFASVGEHFLVQVQTSHARRLNGGTMPLYDFKCEQCSNTFELSLSFENKDLQYCEDCEKPLVRIYTPVDAIFKGTGWGSKP